MAPDIRFPHLHIAIPSLPDGFNIGGFHIAFYGVIIALGMVCGYFMVSFQAKRTNQNSEMYLDLALWDIVVAIIGARLYYVIFSWDYYSKNPLQIFNTRGGGLAIYGGIIAGALMTLIFAKLRHQSFLNLLDTACAGLLIGQIIGRWGNFFNREAFGGYTNTLFAMQIKESDVPTMDLTNAVTDHLVKFRGDYFIQVHPTFLYESLWNVVVLLCILLMTKHKKYNGQLVLLYMLGYGVGRLWIEGLRVDQLLWFGTKVPVSQVLSAVLAIFAAGMLIFKEFQRKDKWNKGIFGKKSMK